MKTILFVGWGRAGKDTAAEYLGNITRLRYGGSTSWAGKEIMAEKLGVHPMVAWETRHQFRQEWKAGLDEHRRLHGQTDLVRRCLKTGEIVAGIRDIVELQACREEKLFDRIVWVTRFGNPYDQTVTFTHSDCDECLFNNESLPEFLQALRFWAEKNEILLPRAKALAPTSDLHRE